MTEPMNSLLVFTKHWGFVGRHKVFPDDVLPLVFAFLVDAQSISNIQRTCRTTRRWNYHTLQKMKLDWLDWVYKNVEEILGAEKTMQLRDGLLTKIRLHYKNIGVEGVKAIGEALKVNTLLTRIGLNGNEIGDEGAKAIGEALKVNTLLTEINLHTNEIGDEGVKAIREALEVNNSLPDTSVPEVQF